jgi:glycosyltransferase involved in cell wall biosynthesis
MKTKNKTSICFVVSEDWYFYSHRFEIAKKLLQHNYKIYLICKFSNHKEIIKSAGIEVFNIDFNRSKISFFNDLISIIKMAKIIKKNKFNIIHSVGIKIILMSSFANIFNKNNSMINAFAGMGHLFTTFSIKNMIYRNLFLSLIKFFSLNSRFFFLVQNNEDKNIFEKSIKLIKNKIFLIPGSGIKSSYYPFRPKNNPKNINFNVIMHSRILVEKGVMEFYQASQLMQKVNDKCKFILIGKIDDLNPTAIKRNDLIIWSENDNFEWREYKEDIKNYIYEADISCLPSYREGFPKSILEDCACGTPVICTDIPGCNSIIKNNYNGLLIKKKSKKSLFDALIELSTSNEKRMLYSSRSRKLFEEKFSLEPIYDLYNSMYNDVL